MGTYKVPKSGVDKVVEDFQQNYVGFFERPEGICSLIVGSRKKAYR